MDELIPKTIYEFPSASELDGTELLLIAQGGKTKRISVSEIAPARTVSTVESSVLNIEPGGVTSITADASKTGYRPIGVVGFSLPGTGSSAGLVFRSYLLGTTLYASVRNVTTNITIASPFRWYVEYQKN